MIHPNIIHIYRDSKQRCCFFCFSFFSFHIERRSHNFLGILLINIFRFWRFWALEALFFLIIPFREFFDILINTRAISMQSHQSNSFFIKQLSFGTIIINRSFLRRTLFRFRISNFRWIYSRFQSNMLQINYYEVPNHWNSLKHKWWRNTCRKP